MWKFDFRLSETWLKTNLQKEILQTNCKTDNNAFKLQKDRLRCLNIMIYIDTQTDTHNRQTDMNMKSYIWSYLLKSTFSMLFCTMEYFLIRIISVCLFLSMSSYPFVVFHDNSIFFLSVTRTRFDLNLMFKISSNPFMHVSL